MENFCNGATASSGRPGSNAGSGVDEPSAVRPSPALRPMLGLLVVVCVFSVVGGYLDAYSFIAYDHVFAIAETGNVILLAVDASGHNWSQAVHHLPPIGAFVLGAATAGLLGAKASKHTFHERCFAKGWKSQSSCYLFCLQEQYRMNGWCRSSRFALHCRVPVSALLDRGPSIRQ